MPLLPSRVKFRKQHTRSFDVITKPAVAPRFLTANTASKPSKVATSRRAKSKRLV